MTSDLSQWGWNCPTCNQNNTVGNDECVCGYKKPADSDTVAQNEDVEAITGGLLLSMHDFDSKTEYERYLYLVACEQDGIITGLELQPEYELKPQIKVKANGILEGFTQSREKYTADFKYLHTSTGLWVIEDVKGTTRTKKTRKVIPRVKTPERNKHKALVAQMHRHGAFKSTAFILTCKYKGEWLCFDTNKNLLKFKF